jgi:type I restriction enzyme S subunit
MAYKRYEKYKDSGVEWIGEIPEHWKIGSLRWYLSCKSGDAISNTDVEREETGNKNIPVIGGNGIMGYSDRYNIDYKTIVIGRVGALCGNIHLVDYNCWITDNSLLINYLEKEIDVNYAELVLRSMNLNQFSTSTAQPLITGETIKKRKITIPPIEEQSQMATFIRKKTSELDTLMSDKEKLIKLLKEKRQAIITEAVTKGLNPNVKMKDSGVEWIGEIPEHWKVKPLYSMYYERKIKNTNAVENNVLSLSYGKIIRRDVETNMGLLPESFSTYNIVKPGNIVLRLTDLQNDKRSLRCGFVEEEGIITSAYITLQNKVEFVSYFTYLLLHSYDVMKVFYGLGAGVRQSMTFIDLKKLPILVPPLNEQKEIVNYIVKRVSAIDSLVNDIDNNVKRLREYKQSLISEAVTGKIDVRELA